MRGLRAALGVAGALLLVVTASAGQAPVATLRLGVVASVSDAGFFIAAEQGYFAEQRLAIEFVPFRSAADMIAPLGVGQLEIGGGAVSAGLFNALARGVDLRIVADKGTIRAGQSYEALIIRRDLVESGRFKSLEDLRGLRIGQAALGISPHIDLVLFAQKAHLKPTDLDIVIMAFPDMVPAMANKVLDGALLIEPFRTQALEQGIGVFIESADKIYPDHQVAVVLYAPSMRREKVELGRRFLVAYLQGVRDFNDAFAKKVPQKRRDVIAALTKYTPVKDAGLYDKMVMPWLDPNGTVIRQSLRFDQEWYAQNGFVPTKVNLSLVVDDRFVLYALERLGRYQ
jgi:NitT/TauT family transport system substrate-binding protein